MKNQSYLYILFVFALSFWSCQTEPDARELLDDLVVATNYDPDADFKSYLTYAIPTDTIGLVSNATSDTIITSRESTFPRPVLEKIQENLLSRGFVRVNRNQNPDVGINVVIVNDFNVFQQVVYPDPYGYAGGYYGGYYGYNSWYYYPYVNTYAQNTGALVIEMVDLKNRNAQNNVRVIWNAYLGDIYSTINLVDQTRTAIDKAFEQSPYISTGL